MTLLIRLLLFFQLVLLAATQLSPLAARSDRLQDASLVILGATLIDGHHQAPLDDSVLVISGGKIVAIGRRGQVTVPEGARKIEARGKWIIPGLIDAHVHFFQSAGLFTRPDILDLRGQRSYSEEIAQIQQRMPYTLSRYICSGVTSVVDMGGPLWTVALRKDSRQIQDAPRIAVAGPLLSTYIPEEIQSQDPPNWDLGSPENAKRQVRQVLAQGTDLIKIWFIATGASSSQLPSIRAAISEAHAVGVRVAVHATQLALARDAVEAGADILVHSVSDKLMDPAFLRLLKKKDVIYIPTLMVSEGYREVFSKRIELSPIEKRCGDSEVIATWKKLPRALDRSMWRDSVIARENLRRVAKAGVRIASGSDAGNIGTLHGPALHRELVLMVEAGISPKQVLLSATKEAAKVVSPDPTVGTFEVGKAADLLILNADPLTDIRNLSKIDQVVKAGQIS